MLDILTSMRYTLGVAYGILFSLRFRNRWIFLIIISCFLADSLFADINNLTHRAFYPSDGLAYEVVRDIYKTPDGVVWFATWGGGISSLDKTKWKTYTTKNDLPSNDVRVLMVDSYENLWAGTADGMAVLHQGKWTKILCDIYNDFLFNIFSITEIHPGTIWIGLEKGFILQYKWSNDASLKDSSPSFLNGSWTLILNPKDSGDQDIRDIRRMKNGEIWVALEFGGILVYADQQWRLLDGIKCPKSARSIFQRRDGSIWVATDGSLCKYDGCDWEIILDDDSETLYVSETVNGELCVGGKTGFKIYSNETWLQPAFVRDIPYPYIESISCFDDGTIWLGSRYGAHLLSYCSWFLYNHLTDGASLNGNVFYADPDTPPAAVDSEGRLQRFLNDAWTPTAFLGADVKEAKESTKAYDGRIWILSGDKVVQVSLTDNILLQSVKIPEEKSLSHHLFQSSKGRLFLYGKKGAYEFVDNAWIPQPSYPFYERKSLLCMEETEDGSIIAGLDFSFEIWRSDKYEEIDLEEGKRVLHPLWTSYRDKSNTLWFGTSGSGVIQYKDGAVSQHITTEDGLISNRISCFYEASDNALWVGSFALGVSFLYDNRWVNYTRSDGLANDRVMAIGEYPKGVIWISVNNAGIFRNNYSTDAPEAKIEKYPTQVFPNGRGIFYVSGIDAWKKTKQSDLFFSWRIVPNKAESSIIPWSSFNKESVIVTHRLNPGEYIFQVRVADSDRNIDPTPAEVHFVTLPYLWQTAEFLLPVSLLFMIAVTAVYIGIQKRYAMLESEKKYRELVESIDDIVYSTDESGIITYISPAVEDSVGYKPSQLIGQSFDCFVHEEDRENIYQGFKSLLDGNIKAGEYRFICRSGEIIWLRTSSHPTYENDRIVGVSGIAANITDRKMAEDALQKAKDELSKRVVERTAELLNANMTLKEEILVRQQAQIDLERSEKKFRTLFDHAGDDIFILDFERRILEANQGVCLRLGYSRNEMLRKSLNNIVSVDCLGFIPEWFMQIEQHGFAVFESKHVKKDGSIVPVEVNACIFNLKGQKAILCICRDITERKQIEKERLLCEAQIRQSRKMEAVGELAGGVAHDFNNFLHVIQGYTQMVMKELSPNNKSYEYLDKAMKAAERSADLTRQLLAFSRRQALNKELLDFNALISELVAMLSRIIGEHIEISLDLYQELGSIHADPAMMEQILMNLCVNARDAMPDGGRLDISTENVALSQSFCEKQLWAKPGEYVLLKVCDTGFGIAPEILDNIFEPFFTTKDQGKGTGLGLSTVYGCVRQHNGLLNVKSAIEEGSEFLIYLPRVEETIPIVKSVREETSIYGAETILFVDDEPMVRDLAVQVLEDSGYTVLLAFDGNDALSVFEENANSIDLIILDLIMPKMNGIEVYNKIINQWGETRVLFSSGYSSEISKVMDNGDDFYTISKPYAPAILLRAVREALDSEKITTEKNA